MLEILKENGADVDAVTKMNDSCLHLAVTRCDVQMISKLISMGANVNSANKLGDSVLQSACSIGDLSTVQMLVENGANVNAGNGDEETPLARWQRACSGSFFSLSAVAYYPKALVCTSHRN